MAATITDLANATVETGLTGSTVTAAIGDFLVVIVAVSNDAGTGQSPLATCTWNNPNTSVATKRVDITYDPGAAGAGATLGIYTIPVTDTLTNNAVQISFTASVTECGIQVYKVSPGAGESVSYVSADTTGLTGNTATYDAPTVSVTSGDIIFGCASIETDDAITGDSDTTMGSWSSIISRLDDNGADASTMVCSSQYKTVTGTGNQSWACTSSTARDSARTYIIIRSAVSGVDLSLSKTLAALTASSAYTVDTNTASLAKTLGALTSSATYTVDTNTASLAKTLGAVTSSAAFTVDALYSLSKTLGSVTSSAAYTVDSLFSTSKTLGAVTLSATLDVQTTQASFDLSKTLGALTSSASLTVNSDFALSKTLNALTSSAAYSVDTNTASLSQTLGALTLSAAFTAGQSFDLAKTLSALTVSSAFTVDTNSAALTKTLGALTASGTLLINSDFSLAKTLGALTSTSVFTVSNGPQFDLAVTLDALTASATFAATGGLVVPPEEGPHGPGWKLFGEPEHHPTFTRTRKAETLERDLLKAYNKAAGIEDEDEQLEAVREIKHVAATALSVGKKAEDAQLVRIAENIIALRRLELTFNAYLARIGEILARELANDADDLEALAFMAAVS
jgi:hypothetical protein